MDENQAPEVQESAPAAEDAAVEAQPVEGQVDGATETTPEAENAA